MHQTSRDFSDVSQQELRVLLDNAPDAIARFDRLLRHVYVNEATARENKRPQSDFYLKTMEDLGHAPEICGVINRNLRAVFDSGAERTFELLFEGPFGPRWFQCRMAPEFESGQVEYVLVMSRDVSEQKRGELAVREAEKRAEALTLAATLAHEINNPLAVLTNGVYLLERDPSLSESAQTLVKLAAEATERIASISKQILSLYSDPDPQPSELSDK